MVTPHDFITWVSKKLARDLSFATPFGKNMAFLVGDRWDLALKRKRTFRGGNQMYFFKIISSKLTHEQARELKAQRDEVIQNKSSLIKMQLDLLNFFYVSEKILPAEIASELANFDKVIKNIFGNVHQLNFLVETTNGTYLSPSKIGFIAFLPLRKLRNDIEKDILNTFKILTQSMDPINDQTISKD